MSNKFDYTLAFVYFIFFIKIVFLVLVIAGHFAIRQSNHMLYQSLLLWRDAFENMFLVCVSFLCLYVFNPYRKTPMTPLTTEMQLLFFLYGCIVLYEVAMDHLISYTTTGL